VSVNAAQNTTVQIAVPPAANTFVSLMSVNGWITILSRVDSSFPLNQYWADYKKGFGDLSSNFWLGLERIYQLTNGATNGQQLYRLRVEVQSERTNG
jgi:ficolin